MLDKGWFFSFCGIYPFEVYNNNIDNVTCFNTWGWSTRPIHAAYMDETNKIKYKIMVDGSTYVNIDSSSSPRLAKKKVQSMTVLLKM